MTVGTPAHSSKRRWSITLPNSGADNPYEAIKVIEAWGLNFNLGNCVKYIARASKKSTKKHLEDLCKAAWYLNREIENLQKRGRDSDGVQG